MSDLTGRTILVTGASKGIGAATVRALGAAGAHVIAHYRTDAPGAEAATADIPEERKLLARADLHDVEQVRQLWSRAVGWNGGIDVLVSNAAVLVESPVQGDDATWDAAVEETFAVNVVGPLALLREATRHFVERQSGVLVTLSSWAAQRGSMNPNLAVYSASKAAVKAATQTIARAHAGDGVLAYVIAPGVVDTQMSVDSANSVGGSAAVTTTLAMGEWVPPHEIADLITFLASGRARHLSGATLDVNGASYLR
jgi:NAD(P)-dependent dehydrogenase (short-subunit alcohol dehydrogenase family)